MSTTFWSHRDVSGDTARLSYTRQEDGTKQWYWDIVDPNGDCFESVFLTDEAMTDLRESLNLLFETGLQ